MKKSYHKIISIFLCLVLLITIAYNDKLLINKEIYGVDTTETIDLTSIATGEETSHDCSKYLISKYDSSQHWQECSICGNVYGTKTNHSFVDNGWTRGTSNDCNPNNIHKFTGQIVYPVGKIEDKMFDISNINKYIALIIDSQTGEKFLKKSGQEYLKNIQKVLKY